MNRCHKTILLILLIGSVSSAIIYVQANGARFKKRPGITFPASLVLDEHSSPLVALNGKVGFISSVTGGALISFSLTSGRVLSSIGIGESVGAISMIETNNSRLIAVPAINDPANGHPATVSIINATSARRPEIKSFIAFPLDTHFTPATRALLTRDARFGLVASGLDEASLFSFNVDTGQIISRISLPGSASEVTLYESTTDNEAVEGNNLLAVSSGSANRLSFFKLDDGGELSLLSEFTPSSGRLGASNNPAFSADGRTAYIAASDGERLFAVNPSTGAEMGGVSVGPAPHRITAATDSTGADLVGVVCCRQQGDTRPGGVTIIKSQKGCLTIKTEFIPPGGIEFSRANNVVFNDDVSFAFVPSKTGLFYAFNVETGMIEANQTVGSELQSITLSNEGRVIVAVRSSSDGDEIAIIDFDAGDSGPADVAPPAIESVSPDIAVQGRSSDLPITVRGENFSETSLILANGIEMRTRSVQPQNALTATLPEMLFARRGEISLQVKAEDGTLSEPVSLRIMEANDPFIKSVAPSEVPNAGKIISPPFPLKVTGKNFGPHSIIFIANQPLDTERLGPRELTTMVPPELIRAVGKVEVQVRDESEAGLVSNIETLRVFGPRVVRLELLAKGPAAGESDIKCKITGKNFQEGAQVQINGLAIPAERKGSTLIIAAVPRQIVQKATAINLVVINPDEAISVSKELDLPTPRITAVRPDRLLAGRPRIRVSIIGANFARGVRVYVGDSDCRKVQVEPRRVHFRSSRRLVLTLSSGPGKLIEQPGLLKFRVVNPERSDNGRSAERAITVDGPEVRHVRIRRDAGDESSLRLTLVGSNFRAGARVEFVKAGAVYHQQSPAQTTHKRLAVVVSSARITALGQFDLRVINPGNVPSNLFRIEPGAVSQGADARQGPGVAQQSVAATPPETAQATVNGVRAQMDAGVLRVFVDADGTVEFKDFTLSNPARIVIDVMGARNAFGNKIMRIGTASVERIRVGQPAQGIVRVVLDSKQTVPYQVKREGDSLIIAVGQAGL